jgi:hypothetical protein
MYRNDLDFLVLDQSTYRQTQNRVRQAPEQSDNSPRQVLWEVGLVLVSALSVAAMIDIAFAWLNIG